MKRLLMQVSVFYIWFIKIYLKYYAYYFNYTSGL